MTQVSHKPACCDLSHCSRHPVIFFSIGFTQEAFTFEAPKIADVSQTKILVQKSLQLFFLFSKMQMHSQHSATMNWSPSPGHAVLGQMYTNSSTARSCKLEMTKRKRSKDIIRKWIPKCEMQLKITHKLPCRERCAAREWGPDRWRAYAKAEQKGRGT